MSLFIDSNIKVKNNKHNNIKPDTNRAEKNKIQKKAIVK